jgi:hypothetical protein
MKKSKLLAVCLIGILMAVGLVLASCGSKCERDGNCDVEARYYCHDSSCSVYIEINRNQGKNTSVKCDC